MGHFQLPKILGSVSLRGYDFYNGYGFQKLVSAGIPPALDCGSATCGDMMPLV
jgi:hypothetical protein